VREGLAIDPAIVGPYRYLDSRCCCCRRSSSSLASTDRAALPLYLKVSKGPWLKLAPEMVRLRHPLKQSMTNAVLHASLGRRTLCGAMVFKPDRKASTRGTLCALRVTVHAGGGLARTLTQPD
jgi:hypothetical protein